MTGMYFRLDPWEAKLYEKLGKRKGFEWLNYGIELSFLLTKQNNPSLKSFVTGKGANISAVI